MRFRTAGAASTATVPNAAHAAPKPSTVPAPTTDATGPAATKAAGPIAYAPTRLNDPTRDSAAAGTRRWVTVDEIVPPSADPSPASSAPPATPASGNRSARASGGSAYPNVASVAISSGRRGRLPSASAPPAIAPSP